MHGVPAKAGQVGRFTEEASQGTQGSGRWRHAHVPHGLVLGKCQISVGAVVKLFKLCLSIPHPSNGDPQTCPVCTRVCCALCVRDAQG